MARMSGKDTWNQTGNHLPKSPDSSYKYVYKYTCIV